MFLSKISNSLDIFRLFLTTLTIIYLLNNELTLNSVSIFLVSAFSFIRAFKKLII